MGDWKSAYAYAKGYINPDNIEILKKYLRNFDELDRFTIKDFKTSLLFSGALFDECNDGIPEWKRDNRRETRLEHQKELSPLLIIGEVTEHNIECLNIIIQNADTDLEHKVYYEKAAKKAKAIINALYNETKQIEEWKSYKYAYKFAYGYCNPKNEEIGRKYLNNFKNSAIETDFDDNFKLCLLYAGTLFDESNDGLPKWKRFLRGYRKNEYAEKIHFNARNIELIDEHIKRLTIIVSNVDPENAKQYEKAGALARERLNNLYQKVVK